MSAWLAELERDGVQIERAGPVPTALPAGEEELAGLLARVARASARVVPVGLGTHLAWCRPEVVAGQADLLLSTRRLAALREYVPGDGTVTAQAGCTLAAIADAVAAGGHRLTPQLAAMERTTIGGALAAGLSGPDRTREGPARHHVLGLRVAHADGRVSRSGGKLVKNVTGFDLHRLYTGSRGTLVVLLEASLRLFPEPERVVSLRCESPRAVQLLERAEALLRGPIAPLALTSSGGAGAGAGRTTLVLAGRAAQVEADAALASEALGGEPARAEHASVRAALEPLAAEEGHPDRGWPQARLDARPSALRALVVELAAALAAAEPELRWVAQPAAGTVALFAPELARARPDEQLARLGEWAALAARHGARVRPLALDASVHRALAPREGADPQARWMEALRARLDPAGRFRCPSFPCAP